MIMEKSFNFDENTYKLCYYSPLSPQNEEESDDIIVNNTDDGGKRKLQSIDQFFEVAPKIKRKKLLSSTVARAARDGVSYISTNSDDGDQAMHLIKIEMYDMKKLSKIPTSDHWKHATTRIKYYVKKNKDSIYDNTNALVYNITKTIAEIEKVKKYFFNNDH
ncbi:uncharacterized protein LOC123698548 [Colias croceus]|uniref:uncharacterized protein LOC123698548 n=1 Tax=Colias crocea TaxID=72248 RepID=UPI001E27E918|nr:uncharacterized protein LOC123698548 [Colias croceus]